MRRELVLIAAVIAAMALLTWMETRLIDFGVNFPISNTVLMFTLININLLLLILLIFLVFRNLVKLLYERRRKVMGAQLRTRLVIAFIALTLLPTAVLFYFSLNFINTSLEFWFNAPIEQALEKSLKVGQGLYDQMESRHRFFLERIIRETDRRDLFAPENRASLADYLANARRSFNLQGVAAYNAQAERIVFHQEDRLEELEVEPVTPGNLRREAGENRIRVISDDTGFGELNRIVAPTPLEAAPDAAQGFLAVAFLIPPDLAEDLAAISRGVEEYRQIKMLKRPVRVTYYIVLSVVALLVVFCALWLGLHIARSISGPIRELADGTRRVAEGDLGFTIPPGGDDEIGSLVASFNRMTRDLRANREQLVLSARMLREQNAEIEKRRRYMEIVLTSVSAGVVTLDAGGFVTTINTSAERMLGVQGDAVRGQHYRRLLSGDYLELAEEVLAQTRAARDHAVDTPLRVAVDGRPRSLMARTTTLQDDQGQHLGVVAVLDDLTDQERAQRMAAWREVARRIAHEVKNPLTPISLSAQRLQRKYADRVDEPVFAECTRMIIDQVEQIRNLVNEFSSFARFPAANPEPCELPPVVDEAIALYREGHPDVRFTVETDGEMPTLHLDRRQIKQALINLVDNAVTAMQQQGEIRFHLRHDPSRKTVWLTVADTGPGIPDADKTRLFEPYFSTKKSGMGLGLSIVNSILADHGGAVRVRDHHPRGTVFILELPV
jgi:two-component system nitrogen regulation sensor histidine kinase NtrY